MAKIGPENQNKAEEWDHNVSLTFHLIKANFKALGQDLKHHPIIAGSIILSQVLAFGVEKINESPYVANHHLATFIVFTCCGVTAEAIFKIVKRIKKAEKEWKEDTKTRNYDFGDE